MRGVDQRFEIVRRAVARVWSEGENAVIAPIPSAGKIANGHDLDRGDAERRDDLSFLRGGRESPLLGEGADVKLVERGFVPRTRAPVVNPRIGGWVDDFARPVNVLRLKA